VDGVTEDRKEGSPRVRFAFDGAEWSRVARFVALWMLIGGSVTYGLALFGVDRLEHFVGHNSLGASARVRLLAVTGAGLALAPVLAALAFRREKVGWQAALARSRVALPLALFGPFVGLVASAELELLPRVVAMAAFVLATEAALRSAWREREQAREGALVSLRGGARALGERVANATFGRVNLVDASAVAACLAYAAYMSFFTVLRHRHFQTMSNDLGQYDNFFWNALHGRPFQSNPLFVGGAWSALRSHAEFSMYALLPFYALHPRAETLLVLQSVLVGTAGIPIYGFARRHTSRLPALVLCLAYLCYAPLHGANLYDLHFQPIGAAFALWALYLLDARKIKAGCVAVVLALASREDVPLIFIVVGLFLIVRGQSLRAGLLLAGTSALYFALMKFVVMPRIGPWRYQFIYEELFPRGDDSYGGVIKTLVSNPVFSLGKLLTEKKLVFALQVLVPLAFLPLRGRWLWLSVLPGGVITVLTTGYAPTVEISFQYSAYLVALMFPAAALALEAFGPVERRAALGALLAGTVLTTVAWGAIPPRSQFVAGFTKVDFGPLTEEERKKAADLAALVARVPPDASLAVSENELPHASNREKCYDLKDDTFGADYLLYDKRSGSMGANHAKAALDKGEYRRVEERGVMVLLKRNDAGKH
jgi:uncharacterized membrane protein